MYLKYTMLNSEMPSTTPLSNASAQWTYQVEVPQLLCLSYLKTCYFEDQVAWGTQAAESTIPNAWEDSLNLKA